MPPLCSLMPSVRFLADLLQSVPASNIVSEMSFAASHVRRQTTHGNEAAPSTLASNHVLATSKSNIDLLAVRKSFGEGDPSQRIPTSAYHRFMQLSRATKSLQEISMEWKALSLAAKAALKPAARVLVPVVAAAAAYQLPTMPWPYCNDQDYPIREDLLKDGSSQVKPMNAAWRERVGEDVMQPSPAFEARPTHTHVKLCGAGADVATLWMQATSCKSRHSRSGWTAGAP